MRSDWCRPEDIYRNLSLSLKGVRINFQKVFSQMLHLSISKTPDFLVFYFAQLPQNKQMGKKLRNALILEPRIYHISPLWCQCLSWWAHVSGSGSSQGEFTNNWCGGLIKPRHLSACQCSWFSTFSPPCASWLNYERPLWAHACATNMLFTEPSWGSQCNIHKDDVKSLKLLPLWTLNLHRHEQGDMQMQAPFSVIAVKSLLTYFLYKNRCCCGGSCETCGVSTTLEKSFPASSMHPW